MIKYFIIIFLVSSIHADWRWSHEPIFNNIDASACHFVGSAYLASSLEHAGLKWWQADLIALGLGLGWEVKDGLVPWEKYGPIGGEGFSCGDIACDFSGIVMNRLFHVSLNYIKGKIKCRKLKK